MTRRNFINYSVFLLASTALNADSFSIKDVALAHNSQKLQTRINLYEKTVLPSIMLKDRNLQKAINNIALPIFKVSNRKLNWKIFVIDEGKINAYTLGRGFVCIDINLIRACSNEAELASVIAHETGHVHYKHAEQRFVEQLIFQQLGTYKASKTNRTLLQSSYSRMREKQADSFIIKAFLKTGYPISQASSFFAKLNKMFPDSSDINTCIFSTHPQNEDRMRKINAIASTYSQEAYKTKDSKNFKFLKDWSKV